jgi:hypothetical protein
MQAAANPIAQAAIDAGRLEEARKEAEECTGWVLPLVLKHSHEIVHQDLVKKTITNLIEFLNNNFRREHVVGGKDRLSFTVALDSEARDRQRLPDLCSLVI